MGPHPDHFNDMILFQYLIDESMLDVDPAGIGAFEVADQFFKERWILKWIFLEDIQYTSRGTR
jgi:hypothetical protein